MSTKLNFRQLEFSCFSIIGSSCPWPMKSVSPTAFNSDY
jgi:hypothetical protein